MRRFVLAISLKMSSLKIIKLSFINEGSLVQVSCCGKT